MKRYWRNVQSWFHEEQAKGIKAPYPIGSLLFYTTKDEILRA